jgi:hypothetical protein
VRLTFHSRSLVPRQDTQAFADLHQATTDSTPYTGSRTLTFEYVGNRKTQRGGDVTLRRLEPVCIVLKLDFLVGYSNVQEVTDPAARQG